MAIGLGVVLLAGCLWVVVMNVRHKPSPETERLRRSADATTFRVNDGSRSLTATATAVALEPPPVRFVPVADKVIYREDTRAVYRQLVCVPQIELPDRWDDQFLYYDLKGQLVLVVTAFQGTGVFERLQRFGWPMVDLRESPWLDLRAPWQLPDPPRSATDHSTEPPI